MLLYPYDIPSLNHIDPTRRVVTGGCCQGQDVMHSQSNCDVMNDITQLKHFLYGSSAQWFLTETMLQIADLRPKAIERARMSEFLIILINRLRLEFRNCCCLSKSDRG